MSALFGWTVGPLELVIVAVVVLLLFGNRLPSVMRSLGRGVIEFKKGVQGIEDESAGTEAKDDKAEDTTAKRDQRLGQTP